MRACVLHRHQPIDERPLVMEEVERPVPRAGETLIRVRACGVCRTDLHVAEGELDRARSVLPIIPGHQVVGEVVEVANEIAGANERAVVERARGMKSPSPRPTPSGSVLSEFRTGDRVGVAWLHSTCGTCAYCARGSENLCDRAQFTGWTRNGGYAEYVAAPAAFVYPLPHQLDDEQAAPLLCAGIIGYRCLRMTGFDDRAGPFSNGARPNWAGLKLGLYGFGAASHIGIQIARHRGAAVYVCTRDREKHQKLAEELGAAWVGGTFDPPPVRLDASIIFAPAGEIIPAALQALDRGGVLVLGGIHMSPTPPIEYRDLYWEKVIRSVANNTREDGRAFLAEAAAAKVRTRTQTFDLSEVNDALIALKHDAIRGAGVIHVSD